MENCYRESDNDANGDTENVHINRRVGLTNPHVKSLPEDHLYHIGLNNREHDLQKLFGDVKFVCFGGQPSRMEIFASYLIKELDLDVGEPKNYAETTDRYAVYKAGPVLSVSHGIGIPSLSIVFQEIIKLLHYSGCEDVTFFRIGTSGGIGLEGGNVVVSDRVVNGALQPEYQAIVLGKCIPRPAPVDRTLANELHACAKDTDDFNTVLGTTLCADDFYEGQGRVDGAFCDHDDGDKFEWLRSVKEKGVTNIEMESLGFIALCHRARVRGAVCCVSLLDRLHGDGLTMDKQQLIKWQTHPQILVARYIKQKLNKG